MTTMTTDRYKIPWKSRVCLLTIDIEICEGVLSHNMVIWLHFHMVAPPLVGPKKKCGEPGAWFGGAPISPCVLFINSQSPASRCAMLVERNGLCLWGGKSCGEFHWIDDSPVHGVRAVGGYRMATGHFNCQAAFWFMLWLKPWALPDMMSALRGGRSKKSGCIL